MSKNTMTVKPKSGGSKVIQPGKTTKDKPAADKPKASTTDKKEG